MAWRKTSIIRKILTLQYIYTSMLRQQIILEIKNIFWDCCSPGPQGCDCNDCGFNFHSRKWNMYLHLYFHFFALVSRQSVASVPPLNTQCLQNSVKNGESSVLSLMPSAYPSVCGIQRDAGLILKQDKPWRWVASLFQIQICSEWGTEDNVCNPKSCYHITLYTILVSAWHTSPKLLEMIYTVK